MGGATEGVMGEGILEGVAVGDLVQVWGPLTRKWMLVNSRTGRIVNGGRGEEPWPGVRTLREWRIDKAVRAALGGEGVPEHWTPSAAFLSAVKDAWREM